VSEEIEMKRDGAVQVKNSGRSRGTAKGDAILEPFVIDYKEYTNSFSVSREVWRKIATDAFTNRRREPALKLVLGSEDAEDKTKIRVFVISEHMFMEMREAWVEKYYGHDHDN
jgi:hypothetical protein